MTDMSGGALARPADRSRNMMAQVSDELARKSKWLGAMLPKEITPERMRAMVVTSFQKNPKLMNCSLGSIMQCVYEAAKMGLEPDTAGMDCHIIPRKGEATFQVGFRGLMKLARRSEKVMQIWAGTIRQHDIWQAPGGSSPELIHTIKVEDGIPWTEDQRGPIVAGYACARFSDDYVQTRIVYMDEINRAKATAHIYGGSPWIKHEAAMIEKTAIKRLCKLLPMPDAAARAVHLDDLADADVNQGMGRAWQTAPDDKGASVTDVPMLDVGDDGDDDDGGIFEVHGGDDG